jgi:RNA polymerase sigma factor (sigma-70 family)
MASLHTVHKILPEDDLEPTEIDLGEGEINGDTKAGEIDFNKKQTSNIGGGSPIGRYFGEVRKIPLLTRTEELQIKQEIWKGDIAGIKLLAAANIATLKEAKEAGLEAEDLAKVLKFALRKAVRESHFTDPGSSQGLEINQKEMALLFQRAQSVFDKAIESVVEKRTLNKEHEDIYLSQRFFRELGSFLDDNQITQEWNSEQLELLQESIQRRRALVEHNLRSVIHFAKRIPRLRPFIERYFLDLIQEGNEGLITASKTFDPDAPVQFITYASLWIKQAFGRRSAELEKTIRLPGHVVEATNKVLRIMKEYYAKHNTTPSLATMLDLTKLSPEKLEAMLGIINMQELSLNQPISDSDGATFQELVKDPRESKQDNQIDLDRFKAAMGEALQDLGQRGENAKRYAMVLAKRFGLGYDEPMTLQEVGDELDLSRERIRQLEKEAKAALARLVTNTNKSYGRILREFASRQ